MINEGIVFLKNSKRIKKLIKKIKGNKELDALSEMLQKKASDFEKFELDYKTATKKEKTKIKEEYKKFVLSNKKIVEEINKESIKKVLVALGLLSTAIAIAFGLNKLFSNNSDIHEFPKESYGKKEAAEYAKRNAPIPREFPKESYGKKEAAEYAKKIKLKEYPKNEYGSKYAEDYATLNPTMTTDAILRRMVNKHAKENGVDPKLVHSIISQESEWKVGAIGHNKNGTTDIGLMQLNSDSIPYFKAKFWPKGKTFDPMKAEDNALMGIKHLSYLLRYYDGDLDKAILAYNAGQTAVDLGKVPPSTLKYLERIKKGL
jgi:hypothetical protein